MGLASSATLAAGLFASPRIARTAPQLKNDRLRVGAIGLKYQGSVIAEKILPYGDLVALCDGPNAFDIPRRIHNDTFDYFIITDDIDKILHLRSSVNIEGKNTPVYFANATATAAIVPVWITRKSVQP